jgi:hypothetical protein
MELRTVFIASIFLVGTWNLLFAGVFTVSVEVKRRPVFARNSTGQRLWRHIAVMRNAASVNASHVPGEFKGLPGVLSADERLDKLEAQWDAEDAKDEANENLKEDSALDQDPVGRNAVVHHDYTNLTEPMRDWAVESKAARAAPRWVSAQINSPVGNVTGDCVMIVGGTDGSGALPPHTERRKWLQRTTLASSCKKRCSHRAATGAAAQLSRLRGRRHSRGGGAANCPGRADDI